MPLFNQPNNAEAVLAGFLTNLGISISQEQLTKELEIHPDYPNLLALNDVANNFGAAAGAYRITADDLTDVPCPFIAHTTKSKSEFVLITSITHNEVVITDHIQKKRRVAIDDFRSIFNGVVLVAEKGAVTTGIKPSVNLLSDNNKTLIALALMLSCFIAAILFYFIPVVNTWQPALAALIKTGGLMVSVLLLVQSIDKNNPLVQALCGGGGKTNCNAILTSNAPNVVEGLSWSEVGFFYFAGTWLAILFGGGNPALLQTLAVLNIISLPYTFYSIYYQWRVARQWCVFCCMVQALLWLEFIPLVTSLIRPFRLIDSYGLVALLICLSIPVALWWLIKPLILQAQQLAPLKMQLHNLKYNAQRFNTLLQEQPKYALPHEDWSLILGNVEADSIITMVTNPYCPPCAKTHDVLNDWLDSNLNIQLRVVFTATNDESDFKTPVTRHLMALNDLPDKRQVKAALHDWYSQKQKNYDSWAIAHPVQLDETTFYKLEKQAAWCDMAEVKATPTLFVNGYRLPAEYQLQDIKYLLAQQ